MPKKLRIDAPSLEELRDFLSVTELDMGCRPFARKRNERFAVDVVAEDADLGRLTARIASDIRIEVLEDLPPPQAKLRMTQPGNRYLHGQLPTGLGKKE